MKIKIATFNVHRWQDSQGKSNLLRVEAMIEKNDIDIIVLQEIFGGVKKLAYDIKFNYTPCAHGVAILSRYSIIDVKGIFVDDAILPTDLKDELKAKPGHRIMSLPNELLQKPRAILARIAKENLPQFYVCCIYLDYLHEKRRMQQIKPIVQALSGKYHSEPIVLLGDFNCLRLGDYSKQELNSIAEQRAMNNWEEPSEDVWKYLHEKAWFDSYLMANTISGPIGTSRFGTRIDYVLYNEEFKAEFCCASCMHFENNASDHNMVICEFTKE